MNSQAPVPSNPWMRVMRRLFCKPVSFAQPNVKSACIGSRRVAVVSNNLPNKEKKMSDQKEKGQGSIEEALLRELRFGGIDKDNLKELVGIVAGFHRAGLKKFKVFPKGQPPIVDGLRVSGVVEAAEANRILSEILVKTPRLAAVYAFPYGTPWPEIFRVNIDIGSTIENGPINRF
jgi:hypothetical protein